MLLHTRESSTQNNNVVCRIPCSCIPDSHPHRVTSTKCRINTVVSPDDGPIAARNMYRLTDINILRNNCAPRWFYLQDYTEMRRSTKHKKVGRFIYLCFEGKIMVMDFSLHTKNIHLYMCFFNFYISHFYVVRDRTFSLQSLASFSDSYRKTIVLQKTTVFVEKSRST